MINKPHILLLLTMISSFIYGQDLSSLKEQKALVVSGGLSINQVGYFLSGDEEGRKEPYSYFLTGNLNMSVYGWSIPLSVSYSNQEGSFQQPFNQFGLTPTYKWIKGYIGYNSLSFSKYTLSGYRFLGGGIEVTPGPFAATAFYGRLQEKVAYDSINQSSIMAYKRMGYGVKAGYKKDNRSIDLIVFHAADDSSSILYLPDNSEITPSENFVVGLNGGFTLFKQLSFRTEIANSAFTSDTRSSLNESNPQGLSPASIFIQQHQTTQLYNAVNASLSYMAKGYTIGASYERIDPEYHTLGTYYSTNDLENISINTSTQFFKGKLNIQANTGLQKNDLDNEKASTMNNIVGSLSLNYAVSKKMNLTSTYSNYRTYTNIKSQFDYINQTAPWQNLDTLDFTQLTQNATVGLSYKIGKNENKQQMLNMNFSLQDAAEKQGYYEANSGSKFYNGNTGYSINFVPVGLNISLSASGSYVTMPESNSVTTGPVLSVNKTMLKAKVKNNISLAYNQSRTDGALQSSVINTRYNCNFTLKEKHIFSLGGIFLWRDSKIYSTQKITETTVTFSYSFSF